MLRVFIPFCVLIGTVTPLICLSCDDVTKCSAPFPVNCPETQNCYTVKENEQVIEKGCAKSCDHVPRSKSSYCETCHHRDFCNGKEQGIGYNVDREHHRHVNGSVEITNDTVVNVRNSIAHSVIREPEKHCCSFWPWCWFSCSSSAKSSFGINLIAVPLILYIVL